MRKPAFSLCLLVTLGPAHVFPAEGEPQDFSEPSKNPLAFSSNGTFPVTPSIPLPPLHDWTFAAGEYTFGAAEFGPDFSGAQTYGTTVLCFGKWTGVVGVSLLTLTGSVVAGLAILCAISWFFIRVRDRRARAN